MGLRRGSGIASFAFSLVVVLAIGGIAWGATHDKSSGHGLGSAKDQAAARATLLTGLKLPAGVVRDPTFTACGNVSDACLTANTNAPQTLATLTALVKAAGGSLPSACTASVTGGTSSAANLPRFNCVVQGELKGAEVVFLLGDAWLLPGRPTPRTAVLASVVTEAALPTHTSTAGTAADVASLLPATWASAPQPCAGGSTSPAPLASAPVASPSAATSSLQSLLTAPPLPACAANALTVNVAAHLALNTAAAQLSILALDQGFRIDGHPCIPGATATSCGVWGERISSGVQELFVATLVDDGRGNTTGTVAVTRQS